jgi:hypothetical protein
MATEKPEPVRSMPSWREHAMTRADELQALGQRFVDKETEQSGSVPPEMAAIWTSLRAQLQAARREDQGRWRRVRGWLTGSAVERAMSRLNAAEADLLRIAPREYVDGELESIAKHVERHLPVDDPRRTRVHEIIETSRRGDQEPSEEDRETLVAAVRGASSESSREIMRVRSFRNVLIVAALILAGVAIALAIAGGQSPQRLAMCFTVGMGSASLETTPEEARVVCPTREEPVGDEDPDTVLGATVDPWDVALVELLGVVAASVAAATSLRGIRGTSTPYSVPIALAALKLPTGALTAVLGLLLMRGQFIPGLSALDFPAQILGWAIVFGYAQQLFTGVVDNQASRVLQDVRGGLTRSST